MWASHQIKALRLAGPGGLLADELVNDAFVEVLARMERDPDWDLPDAAVEARKFLFGFVRNAARKVQAYWYAEKRGGGLDTLELLEEVTSGKLGDVQARLALDWLADWMKELPARDQLILALSGDGYSAKEISGALRTELDTHMAANSVVKRRSELRRRARVALDGDPTAVVAPDLAGTRT